MRKKKKKGEMEREGRGRRGGEKRRGIIVGGMVIGLLLGCNNGGELEAEKRLSAIGRSAENAFYEFIDLVAGTLGFTVTKETTKQRVGQHFTALGTKIGEASKELDKVAEKAAADDDKEGILSKAIKEAVEAAKNTLSTLKTNVDLLGTVGGTNVVGWAENNQQGVKVADSELANAYKALKGIVEIAEGLGVDKLQESNVTLVQASIGIATPENGAKILATNAAGAAVGDKAATIVAAVSGEEMLESIVKSGGKADAIGTTVTANTTPLEFAVGGQASHVADAAAKPAAISGGIALRSLVKGGKLAAHSTNNDEKAVQSVGITAVNKLLVAVEDIIKKTVKETLKKAKEKIDEARKLKTVGNE